MTRNPEQVTAASRVGTRKRPPATPATAHPDRPKSAATIRTPAPATKPRAEQRMDTDYDPDPRPPQKPKSA